MEDFLTLKFPEGKTLKVAVEEWKPHISVTTLENGSVVARGPMFSMLELLSEKLNFRYELYRPLDGLWGAPNESFSWNGMIGMVRRNEVDIALGPFIISEARASAVQFSSIFMIDYFRMMFSREILKVDPFGFFKVLDIEVWIAIFVSLVVVSVLIFLINVTNKSKNFNRFDSMKNWFKVFLDVFGTFVSQSTKYGSVKKGLIRLLLVCIYMLNIVFMKNFSSSLTSTLTVKVSPRRFSTLDDVIHASNYTFVLEASTAITDAIKNSKLNSTIFGKLQKKLNENNLLEVKAGELNEFTEENIRPHKMVLLVEEITCMKFTSDFFSTSGQCEYYLAKERLLPSKFGIIGQKGSDVIPKMNKVIEKIVEAELYSTWLKNEIPNDTRCLDPSSFKQFSVHPYSIRGLWVMFLLLLVGLCVSTLVLVIEKFYKH